MDMCARQVLKQKRLYENQREQLYNQQFNMEQTSNAIESMKDTAQTVQVHAALCCCLLLTVLHLEHPSRPVRVPGGTLALLRSPALMVQQSRPEPMEVAEAACTYQVA